MDKKDIDKMNRKELVELVYELSEDGDLESKDISAESLKREREKLKAKEKFWKTFRSTLGILIVVAALAVLASLLFFPVIQVSGDSMHPTLEDGDVLVLYKSSKYKVGELCCFSWQNKLLIKRVIGNSGDYIDIDDAGNVSVNGKLLDEPYVTNKSRGECDIEFPYQVPEGKIFVMGDQRDVSIDSRMASIGCIDKQQMVGRILLRVWKGK